jgi:hypothetical protein
MTLVLHTQFVLLKLLFLVIVQNRLDLCIGVDANGPHLCHPVFAR